MPIDWPELLKPSHTAIVINEMQVGIVGDQASLPELAKAVRETGIVPRLARLLDIARANGVRVCHCPALKRPDGLGNPLNTPLTAGLAQRGQAMASGSRRSDIIPELAPKAEDVVCGRYFGMQGFQESGLDGFLRAFGIKTVIVAGVSTNIGVLGTAMGAVDRGYKAVIATDCVAGTPLDYHEAVLRNTLRFLAWTTTAEAIAKAWSATW